MCKPIAASAGLVFTPTAPAASPVEKRLTQHAGDDRIPTDLVFIDVVELTTAPHKLLPLLPGSRAAVHICPKGQDSTSRNRGTFSLRNVISAAGAASTKKESRIMIGKLTALVLAATMLVGSPAWADSYSDTVDVYKNAGESGTFFKNCYGYAVFPTIGKGGLGVGAAHGNGRVYEGGKYVADTSMTQVSVGLPGRRPGVQSDHLL